MGPGVARRQGEREGGGALGHKWSSENSENGSTCQATSRVAFWTKEDAMNARLNYGKAAPGVYEAMDTLTAYIDRAGLDPTILHLVQLRASQLNECDGCLDMHAEALSALGETEERLDSLESWRDATCYTDRERAALAWAEAVTLVAGTRVSTRVFDELCRHFSEKEICDLTLAIAAINAWNRLSITDRLAPGGYQPAKRAEVSVG
jgi:AhpD family alkylhydroperoxidase